MYMNLPINCKTFLSQLFQSQKKSDFLAPLGLNAKKSRIEILLEIANPLNHENRFTSKQP